METPFGVLVYARTSCPHCQAGAPSPSSGPAAVPPLTSASAANPEQAQGSSSSAAPPVSEPAANPECGEASSSAAAPRASASEDAGPAALPPIITEFPAFDSFCSVCNDGSENWLCLHCGTVACARYVGGHMLQHHEQTGHAVAFGFRDLSMWCFGCDSYLDALQIPELHHAFSELHKMKFGYAPPLPAGES